MSVHTGLHPYSPSSTITQKLLILQLYYFEIEDTLGI